MRGAQLYNSLNVLCKCLPLGLEWKLTFFQSCGQHWVSDASPLDFTLQDVWSRWGITPLWLSRSLRPFLYSSVYSCYLLIISSVFIRSFPFLSFIRPILAWNVPLILSVFLNRSLVFPVLWFSSISLHCSLRKAFLSLLAIVWNDAFSWIYLSFSPLLLSLSQLFLAGVFLSEQCKEIEENSRLGKTRDLFKKTGDTKGTFHADSCL